MTNEEDRRKGDKEATRRRRVEGRGNAGKSARDDEGEDFTRRRERGAV